MFSFGHWLSTNLGSNNVAIEFLLSRKLLSKFKFNFKFSNLQLVCYEHLTECSHWGGREGLEKKGKTNKKTKKWGKIFILGLILPPVRFGQVGHALPPLRKETLHVSSQHTKFPPGRLTIAGGFTSAKMGQILTILSQIIYVST